jgi:hypothetical protein
MHSSEEVKWHWANCSGLNRSYVILLLCGWQIMHTQPCCWCNMYFSSVIPHCIAPLISNNTAILKNNLTGQNLLNVYTQNYTLSCLPLLTRIIIIKSRAYNLSRAPYFLCINLCFYLDKIFFPVNPVCPLFVFPWFWTIMSPGLGQIAYNDTQGMQMVLWKFELICKTFFLVRHVYLNWKAV